MLALGRSCNPIKKGLSVKTFRLVQATLEVPRCNLDGRTSGFHESVVSDESRFRLRGYGSATDSQKLFIGIRSFYSQTGIVSSGKDDDDLEEGFSEFETSTDSNEDKSSREIVHSELFNVIAAANGSNLSGVLDKWVEEGNEITSTEIVETIFNLQKRRMYFKALQLSEWSQSTKRLDFSESDYACHLDLIAKIHGVAKAENYIQKIPEAFKTEVVYRTLLKNHVMYANVKKAEDVFNKMKDLGFPITSSACNELLLLYKRSDKRKIADVLSLMEKEDVEPSPFTYKLLIDIKGRSNDFDGMEVIIETMKAEGVMPDHGTQAIMARHYISGFFNEKAEAVLKEMEGNDLKENRSALQFLVPLYAALGKAEEVRRIWQVCDSDPQLYECTAAVEAWGKLKNVEEAEAIFERMTSKWPHLTSKHYTVLLTVYVENKMLAKGKDLVKQMADKGIRIGPLTWDALVKLYAEAGEVEKADAVLQKVTEQRRVRPRFTSYMTIMEHYAKRGDVHNTEKIFLGMKLAGYRAQLRQFETLMKAYTTADAPAYGFNERMRAENVFPSKGLMGLFSRIDPFKESEVSNFLD